MKNWGREQEGFPPREKKKSREINLHEHFSLGCHRQSNTFPACTRRLAQEKSQETGLEGAKGKVERRNVTGRPRYGPLRKANFLVSLSRTGRGLYTIGHGNDVSLEQCPLYVSISPLCRSSVVSARADRIWKSVDPSLLISFDRFNFHGII